MSSPPWAVSRRSSRKVAISASSSSLKERKTVISLRPFRIYTLSSYVGSSKADLPITVAVAPSLTRKRPRKRCSVPTWGLEALFASSPASFKARLARAG
jgi:hypothetical protein